jgi:hypothetical protein
MMNFLTFRALSGHVDIVPARPYLCRIVSTAIAFILLALDGPFPTQLADDPSPPEWHRDASR